MYKNIYNWLYNFTKFKCLQIRKENANYLDRMLCSFHWSNLESQQIQEKLNIKFRKMNYISESTLIITNIKDYIDQLNQHLLSIKKNPNFEKNEQNISDNK